MSAEHDLDRNPFQNIFLVFLNVLCVFWFKRTVPPLGLPRIKKDGRSMTDMVIATLTNGLAEG